MPGRKRMSRIHQLDQSCAVHVRVDLGRRDVGVTEQRLKNAEICAAREEVRRERMAKDVRANAIGRDARVGGHLPHDLEQAHSA